MNVGLTAPERQQLRQLQKQRRDEAGRVQVFGTLGMDQYLAHKQPGYWGLFISAQLAHLYQQVNATRHTDCRDVRDWLLRIYQVPCSRLDLTDLLPTSSPRPCPAKRMPGHKPIFWRNCCARSPCRAGRSGPVLRRRGPTHHSRCTRAWCAVGQERPLLTVSGRERVNLNAALNAYELTQVLLDETRCVNAQSIKRLYEQLLIAHPDKARIYVMCDNARYYKNEELWTWLPTSPFAKCFCPFICPT